MIEILDVVDTPRRRRFSVAEKMRIFDESWLGRTRRDQRRGDMASRCRGFISGVANIGAVTRGQIEPAFQLDADLHAQPTIWPVPRQPHVDHSGEWARLSEIGDDGCLLVRPITMSPGAPPT